MLLSVFANRTCIKWAVMLVAVGAISGARAERVTGLTTDNRLIYFDSTSPGVVLDSATVSGLAAGQNLVGIDYRPVDLALVGLGYNAATGQGQVYTLDRASGAATPISGLVSLTGDGFGFDFNPVPNALRIVTNGSGVDNNFRITMGGAGVFNVDGRLDIGGFEDPALGIAGAAYSNNIPGGIGGQTTLYVVDAPSGLLYTQGTVNFPPGTSPNTGSLFLVGSLGLGTNLGVNIGFDISRSTGTAFLSSLSSGLLYSVNLSNGSATSLGGLADSTIADIATDPIPEPATFGLLGGGLATVAVAARRRMRRPR